VLLIESYSVAMSGEELGNFDIDGNIDEQEHDNDEEEVAADEMANDDTATSDDDKDAAEEHLEEVAYPVVIITH